MMSGFTKKGKKDEIPKDEDLFPEEGEEPPMEQVWEEDGGMDMMIDTENEVQVNL